MKIPYQIKALLAAMSFAFAHSANAALPASAAAGVSTAVGKGIVVIQYTVPAPANVSASDGAYSDRVAVTWNAVSASAKYLVYRNGQLISSAGGITAAQFDDTSAVPFQSYSYTVAAMLDGGTSDPSAADTGFVMADGANIHLAATDGTLTNKVDLSWAPIAGADGHRVYRDGALIATLGASASAYSDTAVSGDPAQHTYGVSAYKVAAETTKSQDAGYANVAPTAASASITTDSKTASAGVTPTVTDPNVTAGETESFTYAIVTQPASGQGTASVVSNKLVYTPPSGNSFAGATSFTFQVTDKGGSTYTGTANVTVTAVLPAAPSSLSATDGTVANRVDLSWSAAADATGYKVMRRVNPSGTWGQIGATTGTTYSDSLAADPTLYDYKVAGYNLLGDGLDSNVDPGYANVAPTALSGSMMTMVGAASDPYIPDVTDANLPNDTMTFQVASQPTNGTASIANNMLVYTPNAGYQGTDTVGVTATDRAGNSVTGTVSVLVVCPAPVIVGMNIGSDLASLQGLASVWICSNPSAISPSVSLTTGGTVVTQATPALAKVQGDNLYYSFSVPIDSLGDGIYNVSSSITDAYSHTGTFNGQFTVDWNSVGTPKFYLNGTPASGLTTDTQSLGFIGVK